jgi:hypothetical protein
MTILGKIMVFFVLILSLVWNFLVASAYATRTNYKVALEKMIKIQAETANAANNYKKLGDEKGAALEATNAQSQARVREVEGQLAAANDQIAKYVADAQRQAALKDSIANDQKLTLSNVKLLESQNELQRAETKRLDDQLNKYVLLVQKSENDKLQANIERDSALRKADDLENRLLALNDQLTRDRTGPGGLGATRIPPTDPDFRATVVAATEDLVEISLGSNAKLQKGALLDVWRDAKSTAQGQSKFLGKIQISQVNPQGAVGKFVPPTTVVKPTTDDRPMKGDLVGVISTIR